MHLSASRSVARFDHRHCSRIRRRFRRPWQSECRIRREQVESLDTPIQITGRVDESFALQQSDLVDNTPDRWTRNEGTPLTRSNASSRESRHRSNASHLPFTGRMLSTSSINRLAVA